MRNGSGCKIAKAIDFRCLLRPRNERPRRRAGRNKVAPISKSSPATNSRSGWCESGIGASLGLSEWDGKIAVQAPEGLLIGVLDEVLDLGAAQFASIDQGYRDRRDPRPEIGAIE
jgi:hypothetical protein